VRVLASAVHSTANIRSPDGLVICEQNSIFVFLYFNTFSIIA
jgi:hypothetical protein